MNFSISKLFTNNIFIY